MGKFLNSLILMIPKTLGILGLSLWVLVGASTPSQATPPQMECQKHAECPSGVCNHYKADLGHCAPNSCNAGERTDNNNFFCTPTGKWQASKKAGDACTQNYECFEPTCFMNPMCDAMPKRMSSCKNGKCVLVTQSSGCPDGMKKVLAKEEWVKMENGHCMESMAQRVLRTVCVPCGNGVCDPTESECNCPQDCR